MMHLHKYLLIALAVAALGATPSPAPGPDALARAQDAFVKAEYQKAIALATPELERSPQRAWRLLGACYCFLHDPPKAKEAYGHADDDGKKLLRYICARNQIPLP